MMFCDKLLQLRRNKGFTQEQLADILNVSRQSVSKWEVGKTMPELEKIIAISDIFGVSVDYLVRNGAVSVGILALGGISLGLLIALGGLALGGFAWGGISVGAIAFGGIAIGYYALGGMAVAAELAVGGIAAGRVAIGNVAQGDHSLLIGNTAGAPIKEFILQHYPGIRGAFLRLIELICQ